MKVTNILLFLFLSASLALAESHAGGATTNAPERELEIDSDSGIFDGQTNRMIYFGHVFVTDHDKATLTCERLTVDLPANGGNPTNIVAETNVVVTVLDEKRQTNRITSDRAVYSYTVKTNLAMVPTLVTNEIITFTGGNPMPVVTGPKGRVQADPIVIYLREKRIEYPGRVTMTFKEKVGTNALPSQLFQ